MYQAISAILKARNIPRIIKSNLARRIENEKEKLNNDELRQIAVLVRFYFHIDPEKLDLKELLEKYSEAQWIETRLCDMITEAVNKGAWSGGNKTDS